MLTSEDLTLILKLLEKLEPTADIFAVKQKILQQLMMSVSYDLECE